MPFKRLTIVASVALALATSIACSQSTSTMGEPGDDPPKGGKAPDRSQAPSNTKTDDSCLGKAGLGFDDADCHKCMTDDAACCQKTIACFKDDADCTALHACMLACEGGGGGEGGAPGNGQQLFASTVYPTLDASCGSCHRLGTGGAPIFFGADAPATYALFKQRKYHLPNSLLVTKGAHTGPALTAPQLQAVQSWVAAEGASGGGGGMGDGGGGGEGGAGDGGGNGTGGGCKGQCKNAHPSSVAKWTDYNACVTNTCKAQCL